MSAAPLGILSCVLAILLGVWDAIFTANFFRMSLQDKINFALFHSDKLGMLKGAEMIGLPVAVILGIFSRKTAIGKVALVITSLLLAADLYRYFFGLPLPLGQELVPPGHGVRITHP